MLKHIHTFGSASSIAGTGKCEDGPPLIQRSSFNAQLAKAGLALQWEAMIRATDNPDIMQAVSDLCTELATKIAPIAAANRPFLTLGGDHTCAVGTWSGVSAAHKVRGPIGLIWIDAHMDTHTPETTESGLIYGMPLAALLGHGDTRLTQIASLEAKVLPQSTVLIGVRSFGKGDRELLERLKVPLFYMDDVRTQGLEVVMKEAIKIASTNTVGYGVSIDLDSMDPKDAPGTGTAVEGGIDIAMLCQILQQYVAKDPNFIGAEIAEFDPHLDQQQKTERLVFQLINALFNQR